MKTIKPEQRVTVKNIVARISEDSDPFWKKVRNVCVVLAAIGGSVIAVAKTTTIIPNNIFEMTILLTAVFTAVAGTAIITKAGE